MAFHEAVSMIQRRSRWPERTSPKPDGGQPAQFVEAEPVAR
jgi:hypothetical protein